MWANSYWHEVYWAGPGNHYWDKDGTAVPPAVAAVIAYDVRAAHRSRYLATAAGESRYDITGDSASRHDVTGGSGY